MPPSKDRQFTPRPQRTVQARDLPNSQYTPSKVSTRAGDAPQTCVRDRLGLINNDDMFLQEIEFFLVDYAPYKVGAAEVKKCIDTLLSQENPIIQRKYTPENVPKLHWKSFEKFPDPVKGREGHEDVVFQPLQSLFDAILLQKDPLNKFYFELCPRTKIDGDIPGGNHLIDGCFLSEKRNMELTHLLHRDLLIVMELKKERNEVERDQCHHQLLGACHHILSEDVRRMWIYGITIEKNWMSVWYFSRSHSVKTWAFDWIENIEIVLRLILSFTLATPAQLGVDPLVHKGPLSADGKTMSYVYEVPESATGGSPRFYKTGQSRMPERPMCIAGRVTRIWEVVEVTGRDGQEEVGGGAKCILKDVWLDEKTDTEAENMTKIFASIDNFVAAGLAAEMEEEYGQNSSFVPDATKKEQLLKQFIDKEKRFSRFDPVTKARLCEYLTDKKYRSLFLTKRHAWKGHVSMELGKDVRHCPTLFRRFPTKAKTRSQSAVSESHHRAPLQSPEIDVFTRRADEWEARRETLTSRRFVPKQQSRFVYDEVCHRIDRLPTLGDVLDILSQAIDALHILFSAGWVHRDISIGNILAVPAPSAMAGSALEWKVKLSDLEFSRVMVDAERVPRSDPRTGTPFFMPTEVLRRRYRFQDYRITAVTNSDALSKFKKPGPAKATWGDPTGNGPREDVNLAVQVEMAFQLNYPHLKAFRAMSFNIAEDQTLAPTNLDPTLIPSSSAAVNHNFQHDLESIWWILMWFITQGVIAENPSDWSDALFQHDINNYHSRLFAFDNNVDSQLHINLPKVLVEGLFPDTMEILRDCMHRHYILRPIYGQLDDPESYSEIHSLFAHVLYTYKIDQKGQWRKLALKHSGTPPLIKLPGSGAAPKRLRTRSVSQAPSSSKKQRSKF